MIVSDLIKELTKLPQDKTILGRGYESGFNKIEAVTTQTLVKCDTDWFDGDYQDATDGFYKQIDTPKEYICLT